MSHKALPGIRGQAVTTAEQQLAPTTCSTLTVVAGGQAGPQEGYQHKPRCSSTALLIDNS